MPGCWWAQEPCTTCLPGQCPQMLWLLGTGRWRPGRSRPWASTWCGRGSADPGLRGRLFSQLVAQLWRNPMSSEASAAGPSWPSCSSAFPPMHTLQKPLLK